MDPATASLTGDRSPAVLPLEHWQACPLRLSLTLPAGQTLAGALSIVAELHGSRVDAATVPLAAEEKILTTDFAGPFTLDFTGPEMNQPIPAGMAYRGLWLVVAAVYPADRIELLAVRDLKLLRHHLALTTALPPVALVYATTGALATLAARVAALEAAGPVGNGGPATWGSIGGTLTNQTDLQAALALLAPLAGPSFTGTPTAPTAAAGTNTTQLATTAFVRTETASRAPLASPAFTGTPTAPTAAGGTNTTQLATTAFVRAEVSALVGAAPAALDTLNELASALGNDAAFAATMTTSLAAKAALASPAFTGVPTAPTATGGTNTTQLATTAFVQSALAAITYTGGDVSGSGGGGVLTIAADAVTNAKLANMTALKIKARKTGSTGDPEDCTLSEVLDFIGGSVQGAILYRGASGWTLLPPGTSGQVLTTAGTAADPAWQTGSSGGGTLANPSGTIGLTPDNGVSTSGMRADAAPALSQAIAPTWTAPHSWQQSSLGTTTAYAARLINPTAAVSGTVQVSPAVLWTGNAWSNGSSASQETSFMAWVNPIQNTSVSAEFTISARTNNGAWAGRLFLTNVGNLTVSGSLNAGSSLNMGTTGVFSVGNRLRLSAPADGQTLLTNSGQTAGVILDVATDATLKVRTRAGTGDAGLTASTAAFSGPVQLASYTVATVPSAATYPRGQIYVSDESGGATPAFSDGTNWRRYADRVVIS